VSYPFKENLNILRQVIWYDFTPNKSVQEVIGYMNSISAYQIYLEDQGITKGSSEDPHVIMCKKFNETGAEYVDFVTPYFGYMLGKKE